MSQSLPDVPVIDVPLAAAPFVVKHSCSQAIACVRSLGFAFAAMPDTDRDRFLAIAKGDPTLGVGADDDADAAFIALANGFTRHAVAFLNLVDFVHSARH